MERVLRFGQKIIPQRLYEMGQPLYHKILSLCGAFIYGFPGRKVKVIAVTGTKGKSSTTEIINAILEEAGYTTAVSNTIRFKIADSTRDNLYKMSMPGRFFIQRFLRQALNARCDFVIMEMTSQGTLQFRNRYIDIDTFVFTNLAREHIESHGSYDKYVEAKVKIACGVTPHGAIIVNGDDHEAQKFLSCEAKTKLIYTLKDAEPYTIRDEGIDFTYNGKNIYSPLSGLFNLHNILAAITCARHLNIKDEVIVSAILKFNGIKGRLQKINAGQNFSVIVDYAHTPDSLQKLFGHFSGKRIIAVFGATGGGRDRWKRKVMGEIADQYCTEIILTDDDSYDENPEEIARDIAEGIKRHIPTIITDRRQAIHESLRRARPGDVVLLIGKGTDPYLMGPQGKRTPWSDAAIAEEELHRLN